MIFSRSEYEGHVAALGGFTADSASYDIDDLKNYGFREAGN